MYHLRSMAFRRLRLTVAGRVQGIGFRWFVREQAARLGVRGWARNRDDGTVEIEAEGDAGLLETFAAVVRTGHTLARVDSLTSDTIPTQGDETFEIR